jgi:hypothetical protein
MNYETGAVITEGLVNIYDADGTLVHTVDAPLAEIKQRARAIVDWLNSLDDDAQRLAFCPECKSPVLAIDWREEGLREFNLETGKWEESDTGGYGLWYCNDCGHGFDYEDLCRLGIFTEPESECGQTWPIWTLSEGDIEEVYLGIFDNLMGFKELDLDEVARWFEKAVSSSLSVGYDWQDMLEDAIGEVLKHGS